MAVGHVWSITRAEGNMPDGTLTVVSTQHMPNGVKYRVVGEDVRDYSDAMEEEPSLEDGYMWLMKKKRESVLSEN